MARVLHVRTVNMRMGDLVVWMWVVRRGNVLYRGQRRLELVIAYHVLSIFPRDFVYWFRAESFVGPVVIFFVSKQIYLFFFDKNLKFKFQKNLLNLPIYQPRRRIRRGILVLMNGEHLLGEILVQLAALNFAFLEIEGQI